MSDEYVPERHASLTQNDDASGAAFERVFHFIHGRQPGQGRHEGMSLEQVVKMLRMRHCLSFIRPDQAELLYWKYIEAMTYDEIAELLGSTRVTAFKRTRTAKRDLVREVRDHWNDDLDLDQLPVTDSDDPMADAGEGLVPRGPSPQEGLVPRG